MTAPSYHEKLRNLRAILQAQGADGFVIAVNDEFFSEYPPERYKRLQWLTGFSGSAGTAVVLADKAAFFTDGRYTLQAAQEVSTEDYAIFNVSDKQPWEWLQEEAAGKAIGFDPWLLAPEQLRRWQQAEQVQFQALAENPIDALWQDGRPEIPAGPAFDYPLEYAGRSREEKIAEIAKALKAKEIDALLLALPESVCWLLNLRGHDMEYTPLLLCRALVHADAKVELFVPSDKIPEELAKQLAVCDPAAIGARCRELAAAGRKVWVDMAHVPVALTEALGESAIAGEDPCALPKACKNDVELRHIAATHLTDGRALAKFLQWVGEQNSETRSQKPEGKKKRGKEAAPAMSLRSSGPCEIQEDFTGPLNELSVAAKLEQLRRESNGFVEPSFPTIAGFGPNGAVVHYRATEESNRIIEGNGLLLVDSGGQYLGGTTDVTRTIAIGSPSQEMKENYTRVLKGHIALATVVFPQGTTGAQLDVLARQYLWRAGLDYDHGTGHGVGCFLGVHEGPQGISKRYVSVALRPGMILSNEPGYYKAGEYGIRIENLVVVSELPVVSDQWSVGFSLLDTDHRKLTTGNFHYFRTLTCAPLDERLVVWEMLSPEEKAWWDGYHKWVAEQLK